MASTSVFVMIGELAETIVKVVEYQGAISFNIRRLDDQAPRR